MIHKKPTTQVSYITRIFNFGLCVIAFFIYFPLLPQSVLSSSNGFNPFAPGLGEAQSISPSITGMKKMLREKNLSEFALSVQLDKDGYTHMRSIEFLYPIKNRQDSPILFASQGEAVGEGCRQLAQENDIILYECQ